MKPLALLGALVVIAIAATVMLVTRSAGPEIRLSDAQLIPMGGGHALVVTIDNPGPPDRLIEVSTSAEGQLMVAGALFSAGLPIPAKAAPSLSIDGAHGMLTALEGETKAGRLIPVTLRFESAGAVSTRARIVDTVQMSHGNSFEVPEDEPAPSVRIHAVQEGAGWRVTLDVENFTFSRDAVDAPHQPGVGHGHLYLDGLKLGRIYDTETIVGTLPAGEHELKIELNTNDHRTYAVDGMIVSDTVQVRPAD